MNFDKLTAKTTLDLDVLLCTKYEVRSTNRGKRLESRVAVVNHRPREAREVS